MAMLCPYCSSPFTKEMVEAHNGTYGCDTGCEYYNVTVDCSFCGKNIYDKGNFGSFENEKEKQEIIDDEWAWIEKEFTPSKV